MEHGTDTAQGRRRLAQLVGCLLLLSAFLGILLLFFFQFRTAALQSITVANESFGNYVDSVLTLSNANIRTSAMQVFYTSSIRTLRTSGDLTWPERTIGHRDLGNFVSSSNFIDNIMIYNGNLDMVFTSESGFSSAPSAQFHDPEAAQLLRFRSSTRTWPPLSGRSAIRRTIPSCFLPTAPPASAPCCWTSTPTGTRHSFWGRCPRIGM